MLYGCTLKQLISSHIRFTTEFLRPLLFYHHRRRRRRCRRRRHINCI